MTDATASLYDKTAELVRQAVAADSQHRYIEALRFYNSSLKSIAELQNICTEEQKSALQSKFCEYSRRVSVLLRQLADNPTYFNELDKAHAALKIAHQHHANGDINAALSLYVKGIGCYQRILRQEKSAAAPERTAVAKYWRRELHKFANTCLEEAEIAKKTAAGTKETPLTESPPSLTISECESLGLQRQISGLSLQANSDPSNSGYKAGLLGTFDSQRNSTQLSGSTHNLSPSLSAQGSVSSRASSTSSLSNICSFRDSESHCNSADSTDTNPNNTPTELLTDEEAEVVRITSHINGLTFLPWMEGDSCENFALSDYFTDKDGLLTLSPKQQRKLWQWRRASHIYTSPLIFGQHGCGHIVQETVTDCSFVAALCVSIEYEHRFGRQLITQHIYPQGRSGKPAFNPAGKYMVKLFVNGLWRRVIIDDLLPVAESGKLLCTYSISSDIGQCLLEKAFLKVMGGYDFPGSNSSTDLHVLTGWIPEHIFVQDQAFDALQTWERMYDGLHSGNVLLTIATGEMSSDVASALGLVPSHAYAVLDARDVCGHRLLMVKNPWSSLRWTGKFSHADQTNWTPELKQMLDYDPAAAENNDQGIFWIDFESVCHRFDAIHLNWNPNIFAHRSSAHFSWTMDMGPQQVLYDFSANPQYTLTIGNSDSPKAPKSRVWILLSKHLVKTEENRDFIALHVYDSNDGRRIYEPRTAMHIGEYVNTQHVLVQFTAETSKLYTLVVAQKEKTKPLHFTIRVLADLPLQLAKAPVAKFIQEVHGQWGSASAGGNTVSPRYLDNPQYQLTIPKMDHSLVRVSGVITLEAAQKYPINIRVFRGGFLITRVLEINTVANSGKYRTQFCASELENLEPGCSYTVVLSTFEPFMFSRFKLKIGLDCPFAVAPIAREGAGMRLRELHGRWTPNTDCAGGPVDQCYSRNPRFLVCTDQETTVLARLQTPHTDSLPLINVSVFAFDDAILGEMCASSGSYTNSPQGVATRTTTIGKAGPAEYLVVASTWDLDVDASFVLYFYSEHSVDITPLFQ
ncbi:cysteine protease [Coemansia sp. RSA 989]|nr:cysteine protease [Coemansia sp. RSA 989]